MSDALQITVGAGGSATLKIFLVFTVMTFLPAIIISMTSFARILIVLALLRQALGTPQLPPTPVLIGLSLFLSVFVMAPTLEQLQTQAITPFIEDQIDYKEAAARAKKPLEAFMLTQTREADLRLFYGIAGKERPAQVDDISFIVLVPAFMTSELTTGFTMALYLFIPLVLIDLLVSAVLMSLGMMMVPPTMISLPIKIGVFVLADGWHIVLGSVAKSFF